MEKSVFHKACGEEDDFISFAFSAPSLVAILLGSGII